MSSKQLFRAGACPVCIVSLGLLCLWSIAESKVFFFCPMCEVAWDEQPGDSWNGSSAPIKSLNEVAPGGFRFAQGEQVRRSGVAPLLEVKGAEKAHQLTLMRWIAAES